MPSVAQTIVGVFGSEGTPVVFDYDLDDPLVVTLYFIEHDSIWTIARELFVDAITVGTAGVGDVKVSVFLNELSLHLSSPDGQAVVKFTTVDVNNFIRLTMGIVPLGQEPAPDIDSVIRRILSEA